LRLCLREILTLYDFSNHQKDYTSSQTHVALIFLLFFLGKTEEVFGMHEWAAKQKEKKNEKPRKLKWKIFTRMRG